MELEVFKKTFHNYLKERHFKKIKSRYYLKGENFICEIRLMRSYYGPMYYVDYMFFLGNLESPMDIKRGSAETYTPNVYGRFYFNEKTFYSIEYMDYTEEEFKAMLDKNFAERINPPFEEGKQFLLKHLGTLYQTFVGKETVLPLLQD